MPLILTEKSGINLAVDGGNLDISADAADLLTLIKSVDGTGSGLDADLLDGQEASSFASIDEGTWTPVLRGTDSDPTGVTYILQEGSYSKIGSLVVASFSIQWSALTTGTGNLYIGGLPFPAASVVTHNVGPLMASNVPFSLSEYLVLRLIGGGSEVRIAQVREDAAWSDFNSVNLNSTGVLAGEVSYRTT